MFRPLSWFLLSPVLLAAFFRCQPSEALIDAANEDFVRCLSKVHAETSVFCERLARGLPSYKHLLLRHWRLFGSFEDTPRWLSAYMALLDAFPVLRWRALQWRGPTRLYWNMVPRLDEEEVSLSLECDKDSVTVTFTDTDSPIPCVTAPAYPRWLSLRDLFLFFALCFVIRFFLSSSSLGFHPITFGTCLLWSSIAFA